MGLNMNKNDIRLIVVILLITCIFFIIQFSHKKADIAYVYHNSDIILTIDLNIDNNYTVMGDNGEVKISVKDHKIKVDSENSPYHLCSKQGYISKKGESIVCLPNRIIIELPNNDIDTEVK